jgi:hypothetical protein
MNVKQLIAALEKIHPDFYEQDIIVIGMNERGEFTYELVGGAGIGIKGDLSFVMVCTHNVVKDLVKKGNAENLSTGKLLTEEDYKPPTENET